MDKTTEEVLEALDKKEEDGPSPLQKVRMSQFMAKMQGQHPVRDFLTPLEIAELPVNEQRHIADARARQERRKVKRMGQELKRLQKAVQK